MVRRVYSDWSEFNNSNNSNNSSIHPQDRDNNNNVGILSSPNSNNSNNPSNSPAEFDFYEEDSPDLIFVRNAAVPSSSFSSSAGDGSTNPSPATSPKTTEALGASSGGGTTSGMPLVKAGTVERLIERLVPEKYPGKIEILLYIVTDVVCGLDPSYISHFLLTYRSFTSPEKVLEKLIELFNNAPPADAPAEKQTDFKNRRFRYSDR